MVTIQPCSFCGGKRLRVKTYPPPLPWGLLIICFGCMEVQVIQKQREAEA